MGGYTGVRRRLLVVAAVALSLLAGCSAASSGGQTADYTTVVLGSADRPASSFDPAGATDPGALLVVDNVYQRLLRQQPGQPVPTPDLARSCAFTTPTTYRCLLRPDARFWTGAPVTGRDVAFSIERAQRLHSAQAGPSPLAAVASVVVPTPTTVVFTLRAPDPSFPAALSTSSASIVDAAGFPPDRLLSNDRVVGSGPYRLVTYRAGQQTLLQAYRGYRGLTAARTATVIIQYYADSTALRLGIESREIDVAYGGLTPADLDQLAHEQDRGVSLVDGVAPAVRYLAFGSRPDVSPPIRRALAYLVDRAALVATHQQQVQALESLFGHGVAGDTPAFRDQYGTTPSILLADQTLRQAHVTTPVPLTLAYAPAQRADAAALAGQLATGGLFQISTVAADSRGYAAAAAAGRYPAYLLDRAPVVPGPQAYLAALGQPGPPPSGPVSLDAGLAALLARETQETNPQAQLGDLAAIGRTVAADAVVVPLWQQRQRAAVQDTVTGVEDALDGADGFALTAISRR